MQFQTQTARFNRICAIGLCSFGIVCIAGIAAQADTIPVNYSFAGQTLGAPVITGTTLTVDGLATGSVVSGNPSLNAIWNPVAFKTHNAVDITTGLNNGSFSMIFANGDTLFGALFEDDSAVSATNTGPFTQTLTFNGGTGEFAGATGSVSGGGLIGTTGFTTSGSGDVNAPAIPEPASGALLLGGLALGIVRWRRTAVKGCRH